MLQQVPRGRRDEKLCDRTSKDEEAYTHTYIHIYRYILARIQTHTHVSLATNVCVRARVAHNKGNLCELFHNKYSLPTIQQPTKKHSQNASESMRKKIV